ncbi:MAG: transketolase, partial [Deltaproteobacteria bacterium]|nr:transketolase [Deltaproteobacteria bacterium]
TGSPFDYPAGQAVENLSAFGRALVDVAERNRGADGCPVAAVDCGLASSVGIVEFAQKNRSAFFQLGIQEHAAATVAGAMSVDGVVTVWADRGAFGLSQAYGQLKANDLNRSHVKVVATHLGLDAARDGKAHQCVDYLALTSSLFGFRAVFPADANQTDRAFRHMMEQPGNWVLGLGCSPVPVIAGEDGKPLFGDGYAFQYGKVDLVRPGDHGVLITTGQLLSKAIEAWQLLKDEGLAPTLLHAASPKALEDGDDPILFSALRKGRVVTYEDHCVKTGLGSLVANCIAQRGISCRLLKVGVERQGLAGEAEDVYRMMGLGVDRLVEKARKFLKR